MYNTDPFRENQILEKLDCNLKEIKALNKQDIISKIENNSIKRKIRKSNCKAHRKYKTNVNEIQLLRKAIFKSDTKINQKTTFIDRMINDTHQRQTKEERLKTILDEKKPRINESTIIKTFNRLIEDANRRLEVSHNLDSIKEIISIEKLPKKKKFNENEWKSYYSDSVKLFSENRDKKIKEKMEQKEKEIKNTDDKIIKEIRAKKAPKKEVELIFQRIYGSSTISNYLSNKEKYKSNKLLINQSKFFFMNTCSGIKKSNSKNDINKPHVKVRFIFK